MNDECIKSLIWDDLLAAVLGVQGRTDKYNSLLNWKGVEQLFNRQIVEEKLLFS